MNNASVTGKNVIIKSSVILDLTQLTPVEEALVLAQDYLQSFASEQDFGEKMVVAFGEGVNVDSLKTAWSTGDFSIFPEIEIRHAADINGANGAFAAATNRIYLSQEFITNHQGDVGAIARVLLEEFGHFVDSQLNEVDSPGDEGAIFAVLTRGESLNNQQLQVLQAEDDTAILTLDNQALIQIEMNTENFGQWKIERTGVNLPPGQILSLNSIEFYSSENYAFIPAAKITSPNGSSSIVYYQPFYLPFTSGINGTRSVEYSFETTSSGVKVQVINNYWPYGYNNPRFIHDDTWTLVSYINLIPQANGLYTKEFFEAKSTEQSSVSYTPFGGTFEILETEGSFGFPIGSDPNYYIQGTQQDLDLDLFVGDNNQVSADLETILNDLWDTTLSSNNYLMQPHYGSYYPSLAGDSVISVNFIDITSSKSLIGIGSDDQAIYNINLNNNQTEDITDTQVEITIPKGVNIVSTSLSITSSKQDTQGNTVLTVNPGTISGKSTLTKAITLEVTGFSQPLDQLLSSQWNLDIKGSATANIPGANVKSSTASRSIQVDSSKGLVEKLGKEFLDKLFETNQNLGKELSDIQKSLEKSFINLENQKEQVSYRSRFFPPDKLKIFSYDDLKLEERRLKIQETLNGLQQKQQDILSQAKAKGVSLIESLISDAGNEWVLDGIKEYLRNSIPNLPKGVTLDFQNDQLNVTFTSDNFTVTSNSSLPGLSQLGIDLVKSGRDGNVQPVIDRLKGIVADSRSKLDFKYNFERFNANLTTEIENSSGKIVDSKAEFSINIGNDNGMLQGNITFDPGTQSFTYGGTGSYKLSETLNLEIGIQTTNQKPSVSLGVSGFLNKIQQVEDNSNNLPLFNNFRTLTENYDSETPQSSLLEFNLADSTFTTEPLIERISYGTEGNQSNGKSEISITSSNGQFIAFNSDATNLVANDINDFTDSFVIDLQTNKTEIISVATDGTQGNGKSEVFAISADGRFVIFASDANNLVTNDTNDVRDIFLRDRQTQTTELISNATDGSQANGISDLGNISADGRYAVFSSIASNLVAGDTNDVVDIFVRDLQQGTTERVSLDSNNVEANNDSFSSGMLSISADGRYVVFNSYASNLINDDNNDTIDIFVRDRQTGTTSRINVSSDGTEANDISLSPAISADGRYVVFSSLASNLVAEDTNETGDIFVYDQQTRSIELVSVASDGTQANNNSMSPSISADGRYIVFQSLASNLGVDNPDFYSNIYLRDRLTGETKLVSPSLNGETDGDSLNPSISADGSYIAFESGATNLVDGDTNAASDIFVYKPVILENSAPVTQANKTLTVLEDAAPTSLAIATPTDADNDALTITVTAVPETTKGLIRLPDNTVVTTNTSLTTGQLTSLVFTPITNVNGSAGTFSYTVSDGKGSTATQTITLEITAVNDAPILNSAIADQRTNEDQAFTFQIPANTFTDVDAGDVLTYSATLEDGSALPSWLTFDFTTQTFSGTPTNDNVGNLDIKAIATDKAGATVSDIFTLAVGAISNNAPTLANAIADQNAKQGTAFNIQIPTNTFTDIDAGDVLTYSATLENGDALPTWLSFDAGTQTFSGTPANDDVGSLNVKVAATDKTGANISDIFTLTVENVNDAPTLGNAIADQNAKQGNAFNFQIPSNTFADIDTGDVLIYSATLENGNALPSWLTFNPTTQTFSGTPANDNVGSLNIRAIATDKAGETVNDTFVIAVENINDAPTLNSAIADVTATEDTAFSFTIPENTFTDVDAGDNISYSATLQNGTNLPSWLKFNPATRTFNGTPTNANIGSLTIQVRAKDNDGLIATDTFLLAVEQSNTSPTLKLSKIADDIFNISNSSGKSKLQVTLTERSSNLVNELGVFTVDDAQGKINSIAPGAAGYAQAALDRAKVIFSAIANLPNGFNTNNLTHLLEFNSGENLRFYLIRNSTTDAVRAGVTPLTEILFSDPLRQKITDLGSDQFSVAWKDKDGNSTTDFKDLVVKIQSTNNSLPLGTNLQGKPQGEVIDLRGVTSQVKADFVVNREAAFNNFIGFYEVADENGGIDTNSDGKADIFTGQAGYTEAAVRGRVAGIDLTVNNQGTATYTGTFQPGSIFAPLIIANGRPDALLDSNPNNNPAVYFPFLGANADKVDHIRLLGSNIFGFEDLPNGGDKDFNDVIVRVNLSIV